MTWAGRRFGTAAGALDGSRARPWALSGLPLPRRRQPPPTSTWLTLRKARDSLLESHINSHNVKKPGVAKPPLHVEAVEPP